MNESGQLTRILTALSAEDRTKLFSKLAETEVGFYGVATVTQPASGSQAAVVVTAITAMATTAADTASGSFKYVNATQADAIPLLLNQCVVDIGAMNTLLTQLRAEMVTLGLISGAA